MSKKEFKIGEKFQWGIVTLRCEKSKFEKEKICCGCFFNGDTCLDSTFSTGRCDAKEREDKTDVIFVKVED